MRTSQRTRTAATDEHRSNAHAALTLVQFLQCSMSRLESFETALVSHRGLIREILLLTVCAFPADGRGTGSHRTRAWRRHRLFFKPRSSGMSFQDASNAHWPTWKTLMIYPRMQVEHKAKPPERTAFALLPLNNGKSSRVCIPAFGRGYCGARSSITAAGRNDLLYEDRAASLPLCSLARTVSTLRGTLFWRDKAHRLALPPGSNRQH